MLFLTIFLSGLKSICFEKLLIGMKKTGVESYEDILEGGYNMMRNFVYGRIAIRSSSEKCKFILVN